MDIAADSRLVTDAVIAILEAAGLAVYDGEAAADATLPYIVVHPAADLVAGTLGRPHTDADHTVQVNGVGVTREQAQWASDTAMAALLGESHRDVPVEGRALSGPIRHVAGRWLGRDEDTAGPPLYGRGDDYLIATTKP